MQEPCKRDAYTDNVISQVIDTLSSRTYWLQQCRQFTKYLDRLLTLFNKCDPYDLFQVLQEESRFLEIVETNLISERLSKDKYNELILQAFSEDYQISLCLLVLGAGQYEFSEEILTTVSLCSAEKPKSNCTQMLQLLVSRYRYEYESASSSENSGYSTPNTPMTPMTPKTPESDSDSCRSQARKTPKGRKAARQRLTQSTPCFGTTGW